MTALDLQSEIAGMIHDIRHFAFKIPKNHYDRIYWLMFVCVWGSFFCLTPAAFLVYVIKN